MAKKKKKPGGGAAPAKLNDKSYLSSGRARSLPIYKCLVNTGWEEMGMAHVYVLRKHANENITAGVFLVDTFCAGMKDSFYIVNKPEAEFEDRMMGFPLPMEEIPYELAHNIIYGAIAFAEDYGIEPDSSFKLTQYILEEDTEDVELIELEFGQNGKPVLILNPDSGPRVDYFIRQLEKNAGPGNYEVIDERDGDFEDEEDDYYDYPEDWDEEEWEEFIDETEPEELVTYPIVGIYMYQKTVSEPTLATELPDSAIDDLEITYETLFTNYPEEEEKEVNSVREIIKTKPPENELTALKERLLTDIEKWPENFFFRYNLVYTYRLLRNEDAAAEVVLEMYEKFPDSMRAKRMYTEYLLDNERIDEVPAVFNHSYHLKDIYPERDAFHISEVIDFDSAMIDYFLEKGDIRMASMYDEKLAQLHIPEEADVYLNPMLYLAVKAAMIGEMEPVLREAKQDEVKKLQLIAKLVK